METLDLGERSLKAIPLWLKLLAAYSLCNGIFESSLVRPELKLFQ